MERGLSNDREAVLQLKKRRGVFFFFFIHLQSEEKEGIIDESAAYSFSDGETKQAAKLHCTAGSNGVRPNMRWRHSYMHVLRLPFDVFFLLFSFFFFYSTHQGARLSALSSISNRICSCLGHEEKAQIPSPAPGGLPLRSTLDVWLPTRAAVALKTALCFGASAVLCSAHSCCAPLLTALSVTWRS